VSNEIRTGPGEESLSFSPDGRRLVFQEGRTVWIAAADGSDSRSLTPAGQQWIAPSWSPDSTSLLVTRRLGPGQWALARVSVDSRVVADLTSPVPFRLSPNAAYLDRDHLLIVAPDANRVPQVLITSSDATGGRLFATAQGCGFVLPQVSPDGRTVLLDATCDTPGMDGLWVVPSSGGVPHKVVSGHVGAPTWGPDSRSILFGYVRIGQPDDSPELWLTALNGKGARQLLGTWASWPAAKSAA
jgi:Tol biopolymer transport system component